MLSAKRPDTMKRHFALSGFLGSGGALTKIHELVREMQVSRVMTTSVHTLPPDATMQQLKELLRAHRISGLPVVKDQELVGIVSIEDLIHALEVQRLDAPIGEFMTSENLITAYAQEPVMEALRRFEKTGIGRMPVLDARNKLVGVITCGDITLALLDALQELYTEAEAYCGTPTALLRRSRIGEYRLQLRYRVEKGDFAQAAMLRQRSSGYCSRSVPHPSWPAVWPLPRMKLRSTSLFIPITADSFSLTFN